ncbi:hypothetical protein [Paenibacillus sp. MMS18-CY102]|uniref:hypothetical protein n=1 Tax=Paenibacillus sp. MMS18-CY102 TaxID=2682849 RepID=UPI001365CF8F|nr:hypothetical protein [Paenibacillus sp. MMS18-CY102]MWC26654.1 hypothetical protein [Paenibacillus sp. MMS18-CY102]
MRAGSILKVGKQAVNLANESEEAYAHQLIAAVRAMRELKPGEEAMLSIDDDTFVISKASNEDIARIGCGYLCFD